MAISLISTNGQVQYNVNEYVIDSPDDLTKLPKTAAPGSSALCLSSSAVYVKNTQGEWVSI